MRTYFYLSSGTLRQPPTTRFWAIGLQFFMVIVSCVTACLYNYWLDCSPEWYPFYAFVVIPVSWFGYFYWLLAFYLSIRSNVPKFVSTKNTLGLFFFTLIFFESAVLSCLLWILYFILSFSDINLCSSNSHGCQGLILGAFTTLNSFFISLGIVLYNVRNQLGIELSEAFGMEK
eukprot:TRINITY_DN1745_c0_g1_i1.p1 TRINITY_DN1745_c0_g1~~TRINITY_DN1745_c0_g1_i1.p1  ORF type:complete len:174 (-),score=19.40 TRINITY_DN1745_c0_g1_i1:348-869(-)